MEADICEELMEAGGMNAEPALVERAKSDRDSFSQLYRLHYRSIARYLYRRTGDVHLTEELLSDVFFTALRTLPRFEQRGIPFRSWLYRIATNSVNNWARRRRRELHRLNGVAQREESNVSSGSSRRAKTDLAGTIPEQFLTQRPEFPFPMEPIPLR